MPPYPSSRAAFMKGAAACASPTETACTQRGRSPRSSEIFSAGMIPCRSSLPSLYFALRESCDSAKKASIESP
ncbi:hypothetical protein JS73_06595 [Synergistes jonesii]|uniref:Uncharacterized protein n=1 Tax=Synergistes jonesii TaxID=2754 RepID=A0A073IRP6_9BACT|nr:hypothetical protein EH55_04410 [Synergistes jonesii]OFB62703.1 hypothetical protein JS73_06595 [Synergistes jonesii]OFB63410.1 hypothetical protein JS79_07115 [Synergistes jonesii]OFB65547.1 hypothetical protein JS72_02565 [Synergistes jonesii]OFB67648.1 hypothetical protein JS78_06600 [Synergistes jonesii]